MIFYLYYLVLCSWIKIWKIWNMNPIPPLIFPLQSLSGSRSGGESSKTCQCIKEILKLQNLKHAWSLFLSFPPFNEECKLKIVLEFKITHIKGFGFKINFIYLLILTFYMLENQNFYLQISIRIRKPPPAKRC